MYNLKLLLLRYRKTINSFANIAKAIADFAFTRSALSLISGGMLTIEEVLGLRAWNPFTYFDMNHNWYMLHNMPPIVKLFSSSLQHFPWEGLEFDHWPTRLYDVNKKFKFVVIYDERGMGPNEQEPIILVQSENRETLLNLLVHKKMEEIDSNYLYLHERDRETGDLVLEKFDIKPFESDKAKFYIKQLENAFEKNIKRSLLFNGLPGVGKTTIASCILDHFGFRTLKFRPMKFFNLNLILEFIRLFQIEAVIIDDLDRFEIDDQLLSLLEAVNQRTKLVIGICNSLHELDPALIRPQRFDEIIEIEKLDEETIKSILKELYDEYKTKVSHFPIAYTQELYNQFILNKDNLEDKYQELNKRVLALRKSYQKDEVEESDEDLEVDSKS